MIDWLKKRLPTPEALRRQRWLRWFGPALFDSRLWHFSRRGVATGVAMGVFFGFLVPIGQMPLAAGASILLRANIPSAVASTFITNPVTFGPVFVAEWNLGKLVLGENPADATIPSLDWAPPGSDGKRQSWFTSFTQGIGAAGKPLVVGMSVLAVLGGLLSYLTVSWSWRLAVVMKRRRTRRDPADATRP